MSTSICSRQGCNRPAVVKGKCMSHYNSDRHAERLQAARDADVRTCEHCGTEFSGKRATARYCSDKCKETARSRRRGHLAMDRVRQCEFCGADFTSTAPHARACSKVCGWKLQNRRDSADRRERRRAEWEQKETCCGHCGDRIPPDRRIGSLYCSPVCKKKARDARWRKRAPHYMRQYNYGLTAEQFQALVDGQSNQCAICESPFGVNFRDLHVDHNHTTGAVRGLLCPACNLLLGHANDDPARLRAAAAYLEAHEPRKGP